VSNCQTVRAGRAFKIYALITAAW